jgi:hypothetical protein
MKPARRQVAKARPPRNPHAAGVVSPFGAVLGGGEAAWVRVAPRRNQVRNRLTAGGSSQERTRL